MKKRAVSPTNLRLREDPGFWLLALFVAIGIGVVVLASATAAPPNYHVDCIIGYHQPSPHSDRCVRNQ